MPRKATVERAKGDKRAGKAPSTQAGEFVRDEIDKIRHGEHGARSPQQAIAIGLSEARRAGVDLPPPKKGKTKEKTRASAQYAYDVGQHRRTPTKRPKVARAVGTVLKKEPRDTVSTKALSEHAKAAARNRKPGERSAAAKSAAKTKGAAARSSAARKAAATRKRNSR